MHHESNQPEHEQYRDDRPKQTAHEVLLFARVTARITPATSHLRGTQRHLRAKTPYKNCATPLLHPQLPSSPDSKWSLRAARTSVGEPGERARRESRVSAAAGTVSQRSCRRRRVWGPNVARSSSSSSWRDGRRSRDSNPRQRTTNGA